MARMSVFVVLAVMASGCPDVPATAVPPKRPPLPVDDGGIDYVVNTVGQLAKQELHLQAVADIEQLLRVNLMGAIHIAKASYAALAQSKGMLLNFSSSSYTRGRSHYTPYSASKAAIVNLTQGLAEEWASTLIRVNCLVPGRTDTAMRLAQARRLSLRR